MIKFLTAAILIATLGLAAPSAHAADDPIAAAFVALGDNGAPQARVITTALLCPSIQADGQALPMQVRAPPRTVALRSTRSTPEESKPSAFPVLACEATLPRGVVHASVGGHVLPMPVAAPRRIVVIGDTGCRIKTADKAAQACNDPKAYPFAQVAASAAAWKPDLVVHVGDYLYRENPCPAGNDACAGTPWGYGWDAWNADFFAPAAPLLAAAPWAAARGNHESCDRAGQGWWRFIEPRPLVAGRDCNAAADDDLGNYDDPYAIPLGDGAQIIVLDSSYTSAQAIPPTDPIAAHYRDMYAKFDALSQKAPYSIMVEHHPILGFAAKRSKTTGLPTLDPGNLGLQSVFGAINPWLLPPNVQMLLAGHVHVWEQVSFSSPHPTQFIAGFSGTQEDIVPLPAALPENASVAPGAAAEAFSSWVDGFGFMTLERTGQQTWAVEIHDVNGAVVNRCRVTGRHSQCDTPQVVVAKP
jgi:hypothetical protein